MDYALRKVTRLDGLWDFAFLGKQPISDVALDSIRYEEKMPVPAAYDAMPKYAGKRGLAAYRRWIDLEAGSEGVLCFSAVSMWSQVYVDGQLLHENRCGYAPFRVKVPPSENCRREVVVLVDNRYDFDRIPMHEEYFDFYQYGGIIRQVSLHQLPLGRKYLKTVQVEPGENYAQGKIKVAIRLDGASTAETVLALSVDGHEPVLHRLSKDAKEWSESMTVPDPRLWSPESPALHRLAVTLLDKEGAAYDQATVRFGLRRIEAREGELLLNGKPLILKGYNRHEWHPNFGPSTPELQMVVDLQILKDMGCNFVRGCHYHQDQRFLDLCDEMGILVWEENLGWGQREKTFASERFVQDHQVALEAMLEASFNHPSIVIWGFLNEAGSNEGYVRPVFEKTAKTLREKGGGRLITYASMFCETDLHFDLVDLISINIYPGWYNCEGVDDPLGLIKPHVERCARSVDERGFRDKPLLVSEIGVEGLYGWHDAHRDFFTEEYQADYLEIACREVLTHPRYCGICLWHFSDARTYGGGWSLRRPRTFNNKGTLDEYRRPKLAYERVKAAFHSMGNP